MSLFLPLSVRAFLLGASATIAAAAAVGAQTRQALEDVQIGEQGDILRIALICTEECDVKPGAGVDFVIDGVSAALDLDISDRSALARRLKIVARDASSVLSIDAARHVDAARVVACHSDTGLAPCVEYRFEPARSAKHADSAPPRPNTERPAGKNIAEKKPAWEKPAAREDIPFIGAMTHAPALPLRDAPAKGVIYLPEFAPPERLPAPVAQESLQSFLPDQVDIGRPALLAIDRAETIGAGAGFDIKREASDILGKSFDVGSCEGAKAKLLADAWALNAMIDLAYCKAADGRLDEADADFARLLEYTPDNYEALVGRGMIAIAEGDRELGLAYYQDALNALPPIAESDRIVEAMRRN
ncbi:MAG: hypothetical protein R3C42_07900 [Parvularculaceae bacterium]|nr:hypothetical protein [Parvularculaceae bacterium]